MERLQDGPASVLDGEFREEVIAAEELIAVSAPIQSRSETVGFDTGSDTIRGSVPGELTTKALTSW
jgi:hypothetical protein